jgi:hypothetical protein
MPLSEHEQRLLEEMERSLYRNDADFVATVNPRRGRPNYTAVVIGVLLGVAGIATLVLGVIFNITILGMLGFIVMLAGVLVAVTPSRRANAPADDLPPSSPKRGRSNSSFMDSLNDRWDRRQEGRE